MVLYSGIGIGPRHAGADEKYEAKMHFPRNKMVNFKIFRLWRKRFLMATSARGNHSNFYLLKFWRKMNKRMKKEEMWLCSSDFLPIWISFLLILHWMTYAKNSNTEQISTESN